MDYKDLFTSESHDKGAEMKIKDQFGGGTGMCLILAGPDSKVWRESDSKFRREMMAAVANGKKINFNREEFLADVTMGWNGFESKGKTIKFTKTRILQLYKSARYIGDQVDKFAGDRRNFTKG